MRIFAERNLEDYLNSVTQAIYKEIDRASEDYILNVNEDDYVEHLKTKYEIDNLELYFDDKYASSLEKMIPAEYFPSTFNVYSGKSYKKSVIKYHIPFSGDSTLLRCVPNTRILWTQEVNLDGNEITFEIINFRNDAEEIKREANNIIKSISQQLLNVQNEVNIFNLRIESNLRQYFSTRKESLLKKNDVLSKLDIPIRKNPNVTDTFSITTQKPQKRIIVKPQVFDKGFKPEPTLDDATYLSILNVIQDVGKQFERMPSTYKDKKEEDLRDHILLFLEPNFEGSATGETFNRIGKTDILLRYEGKNVFISECKFWKGEKSFLKTIDQLLSYLTWRDSKASIIIFVENKDFSNILNNIPEIIKQHPCFVNIIDKKDETWFNYIFHLSEDSNRRIKLAVQLFHIPK